MNKRLDIESISLAAFNIKTQWRYNRNPGFNSDGHILVHAKVSFAPAQTWIRTSTYIVHKCNSCTSLENPLWQWWLYANICVNGCLLVTLRLHNGFKGTAEFIFFLFIRLNQSIVSLSSYMCLCISVVLVYFSHLSAHMTYLVHVEAAAATAGCLFGIWYFHLIYISTLTKEHNKEWTSKHSRFNWFNALEASTASKTLLSNLIWVRSFQKFPSNIDRHFHSSTLLIFS